MVSYGGVVKPRRVIAEARCYARLTFSTRHSYLDEQI